MLQPDRELIDQSIDAVFLHRSSRGVSGPYGVLKRVIDLVGALGLAIFFLPLILALVLLVRSDGGKAFYCQKRLGKDGRIFTLWKLRSMVTDAEKCLQQHLQNPVAREEWDRTQKLKADPRITGVGRYLRKYSIDELPQLYNVIIGDMSLVGPRPMFVEQRVLYPGTAYFSLRPGITGLWQVTDRNASAFADRARFDTLYADQLSLGQDLKILLMTVRVVFRGTGY